MTRVKIASLSLLLVAIAVLATFPASGQNGFVIENADATTTLSVTSSSELETLMEEVAPRFVVAFANATRYRALAPIPGALDDLLATMEERLVMEFANANRVYRLTPVPGELDALLGQLAPRFVMQFANASRELALTYPVELVDDDQPPQGDDVEASPTGDTSATITWRTDEYADSTVRCGTTSGSYTITVSDPLYVRVHAVTVTGLTAGTTYYCRVSSTDLSGNTYQSPEFTFAQSAGSSIYLPLVLRSP